MLHFPALNKHLEPASPEAPDVLRTDDDSNNLLKLVRKQKWWWYCLHFHYCIPVLRMG